MGLPSHLTRVLVLTDLNRSQLQQVRSHSIQNVTYTGFLFGHHLLRSFNGLEPGGLESMIRKWKREKEREKERHGDPSSGDTKVL